MKHTICCIDDKIPVSNYPDFFDETKILDGQVIRFLLKKDPDWEDSAIKELFSSLLDDPDWSVTAFTAPSFYENHNMEEVFSPDVIVFDWDYNTGPGGVDSADALMTILRSSYSIVFVLSGGDNIDAINSVVCTLEFKKYENRLEVVPKEQGVSAKAILDLFRDRESSLFTYKYGYSIVRKSNKAINRILSDISLLSIPGFISAIGEKDAGDYYVSNEVFIDAMIPRFRKALSGIDMDGYRVKQEKEVEISIEDIKEIWRYRLYDDTTNDCVSMGDIVHDEEDNLFYLVFSSDCHMKDLWKKNGGYVSLIPLLKADRPETKELVRLIARKDFSITSLTSNSHPFTFLPAVPINNTSVDFVVFPKSISSVQIKKLNENQENCLKYQYWPHFKRIASILDPFKSPLIQFVADKLTGYGCPDYPSELKDYISTVLK